MKEASAYVYRCRLIAGVRMGTGFPRLQNRGRRGIMCAFGPLTSDYVRKKYIVTRKDNRHSLPPSHSLPAGLPEPPFLPKSTNPPKLPKKPEIPKPILHNIFPLYSPALSQRQTFQRCRNQTGVPATLKGCASVLKTNWFLPSCWTW